MSEMMLVVECVPAAYVNYLTNEAEKRANINVIHVRALGAFGRLWLSGTDPRYSVLSRPLKKRWQPCRADHPIKI